MVLHLKTWLPSSHLIPITKTKSIVCEKEGESCHELGLVCNLDEKRTSLYNVSEDNFF
jgi:hypothetical protein